MTIDDVWSGSSSSSSRPLKIPITPFSFLSANYDKNVMTICNSPLSLTWNLLLVFPVSPSSSSSCRSSNIERSLACRVIVTLVTSRSSCRHDPQRARSKSIVGCTSTWRQTSIRNMDDDTFNTARKDCSLYSRNIGENMVKTRLYSTHHRLPLVGLPRRRTWSIQCKRKKKQIHVTKC